MTEVKFKKDKDFEEKIAQAIITDHNFAEQIMDTLNVEYFNLDYTKELVRIVYKYYEKYEAFPSLKLLASIITQEVESESLLQQMRKYLVEIYKTPLNGDGEYVKESTIEFCKKRSLARALETSLELIADKKYEAVVDEIQKAIFAGSEKDIGHVLPTGLAKRLVEIENEPIPTGWKYVDEITRGGPGRGKLCSILGASGAGKSHLLVDIGANMAMAGFNVVHYTMELTEEETGLRYDSRISGINIDDIKNNQEEVQKCLSEVKGSIIIKYFSMYSISSMTIKSHLKQLAVRGMMPDAVLIDYADLMRSRRQNDALRLEQQFIYGELKALAKEMGVVIHTVCQSNRDGTDVEVLTEKHIGESYTKYQLCDVFLTLSRKKENKPITSGNLFVAKNRLGVDGVLFPINMNTSQSKVIVMSPNTDMDVIDLSTGINREHIKEQLATLRKKMEKVENR